MDLMRRLRLAGRPNSSHPPRSHQSSSQQQVGRPHGGPTGRTTHTPPPAVTPAQHVPTPLSFQDPLTVPSPVTNNNNTTFPWRFHSGVVVNSNRSRRQLRPSRSSFAGLATQKSHCQEYPESWTNWQQIGVGATAFVVSSDNIKFPVHPVVLAGASPVFKSLFSSWRPQNGSTFSPDGSTFSLEVDHVMLGLVLKYIYTGVCHVTPENVESLLDAANRFKVVGIIQRCCQVLHGILTPQNSVKIYNVAKSCLCSQLQTNAKMYLLHNFKAAIDQSEFLNLDYDELSSLLRDDCLNVRSEELAFSAIQRWTEHDPEKRLQRLVDLLGTIRFGLMHLSFFNDVVMTWQYIATNPTVIEGLLPAQMFLAAFEGRNGSDLDPTEPLTRPRVPYEIIFAIGGWSAGSPTSFMETYDVRADRWFLSQGSDVTPRAYHGLVTLGHSIYMIGGFDGNEHFNTMRCFDTMTRTWTEKANMHYPRCYISCCVLNGQIYAIGGFNGRIRMNSVERYNPPTNQWEVCPPMTRQRSDASACALLGKVYVAGGFNGQEVLNSVEVFDPVENQWTFILPMKSPRSGVVVTAHKNKLYAIGGFNGFSRLSSAETYDPTTPRDWEYITDMSSPRSNFAAAIVDDMIFVIGGFNGTTTIPYVECYDSNQNLWIDAAHMNLNRSALAACVLRGLPNARDFSYLSRVQEILGLGSTNDTEDEDEPSPMATDSDSESMPSQAS